MKNERIIWLVVGIVAALALVGGGMTAYMNLRGIRNNNPGNIRVSATRWQGQIGDDGAFVIFDTAENGIRAMARVLGSYANRGVKTVRQIISTWAPPTENDTESYVASVSKRIGLGPNDTVPVSRWPDLIAAIIKHENGVQPYNMETIVAGVSKA